MGKGRLHHYLTLILTLGMGTPGMTAPTGQAASVHTSPKPFAHPTTEKVPQLNNFGGQEISLGKPAPLTIVMYYSLTCPHCHEFQKEGLPKIQKEFIDKGLVQFIFRDFPTDSFAIKAAKIAWSHGARQYLPFAQKLLETQDQWVPKDPGKIQEADKALQDIALKELGISEADYNKCLANEDVEKAILRTSFEAQKNHQISAAPAFLVNGKVYEGNLTPEEIDKLLRDMGIHG
ncbi:MAG: hypothetical protein K0R52_1415 [Alphaproteobacteria bacterium]|jgi:protein-disulfide isomerase|nr:hypothetical protein [Alphaproteobacteria bacterium]